MTIVPSGLLRVKFSLWPIDYTDDAATSVIEIPPTYRNSINKGFLTVQIDPPIFMCSCKVIIPQRNERHHFTVIR